MDSAKPLKFTGTAGGFFVAFILYMLLSFIPLVGWVLGINYFLKWFIGSLEVNGKKVAYKTTLGESFVFFFVGALLTIVTLGIYTFWFVPKAYRFIAEHTVYDDGTAVAEKPAEAAAPAAPAAVSEGSSPAPAATPGAETTPSATPPSTPETPSTPSTPPATPGAGAPTSTPPQGPVVG